MKITDIHVGGFGVWSDLQLRGLSPRATVFYGANEAGKSTLMQFVRSVLYGYSAETRKRYFPPLGGRPAGRFAGADRRRRADDRRADLRPRSGRSGARELG